MQPRFKSPTVTPHFPQPYRTTMTRAFGRCVPTSHKKMQVSTSPATIQKSYRYKSLPLYSGDTRLSDGASKLQPKKFGRVATSSTTMQKSHPRRSFSAFPAAETHAFKWCGAHFTATKKCRVSTSPPTMQRSHRNMSLPQTSPQRRHTRFGRCVPTSPKKNASFHLSTHDAKVPPLHVASSAFPTAETHAFRAVRPHFTEKVCESRHLCTHDSKVPP